MDAPFNQVSGTIRRLHSSFSRDFTVTQYTWDSTASAGNAYADDGGDFTSETLTVRASIRIPEKTSVDSDSTGQETDHDVKLWMNPDDVSVSLGQGDEERATRFTDSSTGRTYEAVGSHDEGSLLRVLGEEVN